MTFGSFGRTAQISAPSDSAFHREHSSQNRSLMSTPLITDSPRSQPTRLVFCGAFCLWAKLHRPPDITSAASDGDLPLPGSGSAVVVPDDSAAGCVAADLARPEVRDGYLRRWQSLGGIRQGAILLPLVWPAFVIVPAVVGQGALQTSPSDKPAPPDTLALHRAHPALGDGIEVGAARRDRDGLDATARKHLLPPTAELGVAIMDQILGTNLGQPADVDHGVVARRLGHEVSIGVLGDASDVDASGPVVDGEQHIVAALAQPTPDVDGEKVCGDDRVEVLRKETLPGGVRPALGRRLEAMAIEDRGNSSRSESDSEFQHFTSDAHLSPGGVLLGQADDRLLDLSLDRWSPRPCTLHSQLAGNHQSMPTADGARLGHAGDLGQSLPTNASGGPGEFLSPSVGEPQGLLLGDLLAKEADLCAQERDLRDERFVLLSQDGCSDEPDEKRQAGHGAAQSSAWWNSFKLAKLAA